MATTQPMGLVCRDCGHAAHAKPCAEILDGKVRGRRQYGPDDIGEPCGCGAEGHCRHCLGSPGLEPGRDVPCHECGGTGLRS